MSLLNAIRDYTELLNNFSDSVDLNVFQLIKFTVLYLVNSVSFIFFYLISFQWIKDISHLPVLLPNLNAKILNEYYVLDNHLNLIELGPISSLEKNKLILGFLNAFFLALPFSVPQFLGIRRWLIQGSVAGLASMIGFRVGQTLFFASILLGFRFLVIPWLTYEPLTYSVGLVLLVNLIYEMTHENLVAIPQSQTFRHFKIFLLHLGLAWTEQTALFQYFSNNTFSTNFTNLDIFVTLNNSEFWFTHFAYILGLFIGGLFFDLVFLIGLANFIESFQIWFKLPLSTWKKQSNIWFLRLSLALSFSSLPYYTLDYLFLSPLGFVSQDKSIVQSIDSLFTKDVLSPRQLIEKDLFLDPFNRPPFLNTSLEGTLPSTFETRNFEGERAWEYAAANKKANISDNSQKTKDFARRFFNAGVVPKVEKKSEMLKVKPSDLFNLYGTDPQAKVQEQSVQGNDQQPFNPAFANRVTEDYSPSSATRGTQFQDDILQHVSSYFPTFLNDNVRFNSREESVIKNKFYANPVYKNLVGVYVDSILQQQPKEYFITKDQEKQLYEARLVLEDYYNSLRNYADLSYWQQFQYYFGGTKSFSAKVYNQQFKGDLKVVRRLFGVTWDKEENPNELRKLSFDQTLYESTPANFYHEELNRDGYSNEHALINPMPFYAGWDSNLRKFVISNRYVQRDQTNKVAVNASLSLEPNTKIDNNAYTKLQRKNSMKKDLENQNTPFTVKEFSSWPLLSSNTKRSGQYLFQPSRTFDEIAALRLNLQMGKDTNLEEARLPQSVKFLLPNHPRIFPPNNGGFLWPGENKFQFQKSGKERL